MTNFISYNKYQKVYMSITYYTGQATLFYKLLSLLPFFKMKKNLTNSCITLMQIKIYFDSDWKKKFCKKQSEKKL